MTSAPLNFYVRVDLALKDHALGAAMDRATKKLVSSREAGMAAFPEADAVRDHARRIRAHTVGQLGQYLRQFEQPFTPAAATSTGPRPPNRRWPSSLISPGSTTCGPP
jgi:L-lactate dehydrogenase complex protein LldF